MRKDRWGVFVCSCEKSLKLDAEQLQGSAPVVCLGDHPAQDAARFAGQLREEGVTRAMVACCQGLEPFSEALREAGALTELHAIDLKQRCYLPHAEAGAANQKAVRLLKGAMLAEERSAGLHENPLQVGRRLLVVTDHADGLRAAQWLGRDNGVILVVEGRPGSLAGVPEDKTNWAELAGVEGRLGQFNATLRPINARGKRLKEKSLTADQVVVIRSRNDHPLRRATGVHVLEVPLRESPEELNAQVAGLSGDFMKPEHLSYDEGICAGGSAEHQACGRCIEFCPYQAVARNAENPLRMRVDHLACEGCGACTAACPTGAMAFADPSPAQLYNRLAGLLTTFGANGEHAAPPVIAFHCPEQGASALDRAGEQPLPYAASIYPVEVPCLRFVSTSLMLGAIRMGAAGVALLGCDDCPHGERELLLQELDLTGRILDALELDSGRVRLLTAGPDTLDELIAAADTFAGQAAPSPMVFQARSYHAGPNRDMLADTLSALIGQTGKSPGGLALKSGEPFALADIREEGCTLCRSCANVCPTHAFRFDENDQSLSFKHVFCVACGLCEQVCPEDVISLRRELYLEKDALDWQVMVQDEMIHCARCQKPYINKRALETVEGRVLDLGSLLDTFQGNRRDLLKMCPDCRAVDAMFEVEGGWEP